MTEVYYALAGLFIGIITTTLLLYKGYMQNYDMYHELLKKFEKSRVNLYTHTMAEKDMNTGKIGATPASILKWSKVANALSLIKAVIDSPCGLCIEYSEPDCSICPLHDMPGEKCLITDSTYQKVRASIRESYHLSLKMWQILKKV